MIAFEHREQYLTPWEQKQVVKMQLNTTNSHRLLIVLTNPEHYSSVSMPQTTQKLTSKATLKWRLF